MSDLYAELLAAPHDPAPCLVYADALREQGRTAEAAAWQVLGGVAPYRDKEARQLAVAAVACAHWLAEPVLFEDEDAVLRLADRSGLLEWCAGSALRRTAEPPPELLAEDPLAAALRQLRDGLVRRDGALLGAAARAARTLAPSTAFHALFGLLTTSGLMSEDRALARTLNRRWKEKEIPDEPPPFTPFTFAHVMITNSTQGVDGVRVDGLDPRPALAGALLALGTIDVDVDELDELGEASPFAAISPFAAYGELFNLRANNEGHEVFAGEGERPLLELLLELGPLRGAAHTTDDFPITMLRFERSTVVLHFIY